MRRVVSEARPYWHYIAAILILDLVAIPLLLLTPIPLKLVVDSVLAHHPLPGWLQAITPHSISDSGYSILLLAAGLQVAVVLAAQLQQMNSYMLSVRAGETLTLGFRARLFRHVQRLSLGFHDRRGTADSIYRIEVDAPSLQYLIVYGLIPAVSALTALLTTIYVIVRIDWQLALVAIGVCPVLVVLSVVYDNRMRPRYRNVKGLESGALKVVQEVLTSLRVVKAFGREEGETQRFERQSLNGMRSRIQLARAEGMYGVLLEITVAAATAIVLVIGVLHVQSGILTLGGLLMVTVYLSQLYSPLKTVTSEVAGMQSSLASIERTFDLMDEPTEVPDSPLAVPLNRAKGRIEFENVSFGYGGPGDVLHGISFVVAAGQRLGIAGKTGSGKSTIASLLTRFYDPTSGRVLLDGKDLRDYRLADLRNQFAIVLQDTVLFSTSIGENVRYGRAQATLNEVRAAARAAGAADFIEALADGYDTQVGERGMLLSGGERQRLALARAFLKDAPILILDEPTSSVDVRTEKGILQAMETLMAGRTTIMIAHRLGTLDICDLAIEIAGGRLVDSAVNRRKKNELGVPAL